MGAYLSSPVTDKESGEGLNYGYSSMQGWRTDHEDAHICESELLPGLSLFAVFDGHGGAEVARFASRHIPDLIRSFSPSLTDPASLSASLIQAFEGLDVLLRNPEYFGAVEALKTQKQSVGNPAQKPQALVLLQQSIAADLQELRDRGGAVSREEAAAMMMKMMFARKLEAQVTSDQPDTTESPAAAAVPGEAKQAQAGCTANAVLLTEKVVVCGNAGDSRAVLSRGGVALGLSEDHKPNEEGEKRRIENAGGWVETIEGTGGGRTHYRVNGNLNLSRALGDLEYKKREDLKASEQIISATPDVSVTERKEEDEFVLIACDGIWDVKDNQAAVDFCREKLYVEKKSPKQTAEELLDACLAKDAKESQGIGADNMTAIIVLLKNTQ
jgi:protein phosphatase 1G